MIHGFFFFKYVDVICRLCIFLGQIRGIRWLCVAVLRSMLQKKKEKKCGRRRAKLFVCFFLNEKYQSFLFKVLIRFTKFILAH